MKRQPRRFEVFGPFDVPVKNMHTKPATRKPDAERCKARWRERDLQGLRAKKGCYIFALRRGQGYLPVYVGKTSRSFEQECFQPHKLLLLQDALEEERGTLVVFLLCYEATRGAFDGKALGDLERYLITAAARKNPNLQNKKGTNFPTFMVPGLTDPARGKPSNKTLALQQMLGMVSR
ncbi:MAG: hypothetical protein ACYCVC_18730 [Acidimicrobiales bacterium]